MTLRIIDCIAECRDGRRREVDLSRRTRLVIHRCGFGPHAVDVARAFREVPDARAATGGEMPYTFVLPRHGGIEQALEMGDYGPHARRWSLEGIGIAVVGDFRTERPTLQQTDALLELCVALCRWLGNVAIWGHDELAGGSSDPAKQCPGLYLNVAKLRDAVRERMTYEAQRALSGVGVVF